MKLNKKGFAISTMLYGLIFVTIAIFYMIIALVSNRYEHNVSFVEDLRENLEVTGELQLSLNQKIEDKKATCTPTITDTDGTVYFSGTSSCVDFNYVWYSGKLWRIVAIYQNGTMKMVTNDTITVLSGGTSDYNQSAYAYKWLNNDFKDTLYNYDNIIVTNYSWNKVATTNYQNVLPSGDMLNATVGLLNVHEYYKAYQNSSASNNYLHISGDYSWLMNSNGTDNNIYYINSSGAIDSSVFTSYFGIRPAVVLRSHIYMNGGSGSVNDPYTIEGDIGIPLYGDTNLNSRVSGEYVSFVDSSNFTSTLYRIVDIEPNGTVRLVDTNQFYDATVTTASNRYKKGFARSYTFGSGNSRSYWDYYLNNYWVSRMPTRYSNYITNGVFYLGTAGYDYRTTVCDLVEDKTNISYCIKNSKVTSNRQYKVGFLRYGEMFAAQDNNNRRDSFFLITPQFYINSNQVAQKGFRTSTTNYTMYSGRIVIFIKENVKIKNGKGTRTSPFIIV